MRPLTVEYIYRQPIARFWMRLIRAVSIPNFDTSVNQLKLRRGEKAMDEVVQGLRAGDSFLIYPAGRLKSSPQEMIGGSSGAHQLVQKFPEANIVLIRTTGLWGSSFSRAIEGVSPDLVKAFLHGAKVLIQNLFFFTPRRRVVIEFEVAPADLPRKGTRVEFNRFLEKWYNQYLLSDGSRVEEEPLSLVSYKFWKNEVPQPFDFKKPAAEVKDGQISPETRDRIYQEIREILVNPDLEIRDEMLLESDLGMDSLNIAELIACVTRHWDVQELHPSDIDTVRSVLEVAEGLRKSSAPQKKEISHSWGEEKGRPAPCYPRGKTLAESFLLCADRMDGFQACGDDLSGVYSYKKFKRAALVLANHFRTYPEERVGVLLPSSAAAYLTIWALQLAGKVPVMVNWTIGSRFIDEMVEVAGVKRIISSWKFLERISNVEFGTAIDQMELLEEIRDAITLKEKLKGAFQSFFNAKILTHWLKLHQIDEHAPAVILFTSGTEAKPKGVPLSHKNILSDLVNGLKAIELLSSDVMYGFLPPFHSFGFTVIGVTSFTAGIRCALYPDPTDSFSLAEGVNRWRISIICSAPNFLRGIMQAAKPGELSSLRMVILGAEKTTEELQAKIRQMIPGSKIVEGYGATECSPIISISRMHEEARGVGQLISEMEGCTIHPETQELLPPGTNGEVCVRGPNVFRGYLGNETKSPFIQIDGKKWYRTGDLGFIDAKNYVVLSGRLKRFVKMGGEMISLAAVEDALSSELRKNGKIPTELPGIAVCSDDRNPDKSQLILFATVDLTRDEVNELLKGSGFSRIVKIAHIHKVAEIPLMGTGKTDYRRLQSTAL